MSIAILCPTRGRPEQCKRMIESANATASGHILIWIAVSFDEVARYQETLQGIGMLERVSVMVFAMAEFTTVHKWNELAQEAMKHRLSPNIFMLGSDDMYFDTPGWDKALIDHYNALENKIHVYALQDSRDPDGTPHPIVTREYIEALGYFVPPIFLHWFVDSWTVEIAKANECFTHLKDYRLVHDKPSDKGQGDETHNRIRQWGWSERDKFVNDHCQHFLECEKKRLSYFFHDPESYAKRGIFVSARRS